MAVRRPYPTYPDGMILLVEVGSTAHGTGLPGGEDQDETAIVVENPSQVLGLGPGLENHMQRTQPEGHRSGPGDTDRQVYSLRKFLAMAAAGNPSILLTMWAPVIETSDLGRDLVGLRDAFVGRHVLPRYQGYMQSQVMRMQGLKGSGTGAAVAASAMNSLPPTATTPSSPCTRRGSATRAVNSSPPVASSCPWAARPGTGCEPCAGARCPTTNG